MKIYILAKIIVENYYNRYYTPMLDTGAEANMCKHNCLPDEKWEKLKTPIVVTGFNNEGSMITVMTLQVIFKLKNSFHRLEHFCSDPKSFMTCWD